MRKFLLLSLFILLHITTAQLQAQKISVNARIDSTVLMIGDQTRLTFEVSQQPKQKVIMPLFSDTINGGLEMVEPVKTDTIKSPDGHIQVNQSYLVTFFEDSLLYIPSFPFVTDGDTVWSKSLSLKVVQPFQIDTASSSIADIKPVLIPKYNWMGLIKLILIILFVLALLVVAFIFIRKYLQNKPVFEKKVIEPLLPAHLVALNELDRIKSEKAWQNGRTKEFHTELTDVIRIYIEKVFDINSMEMTSEEILEHLQLLRNEQKSAYTGLHQILKLADLVKFAKWNALPNENELSLLNAYLFVNQTKVEEMKPLEELISDEKKTIHEEA
jgi:hypothetical protein